MNLEQNFIRLKLTISNPSLKIKANYGELGVCKCMQCNANDDELFNK